MDHLKMYRIPLLETIFIAILVYQKVKTPRQGRPDVEANLVKLLFFFGMWLSCPEILEFLADRFFNPKYHPP